MLVAVSSPCCKIVPKFSIPNPTPGIKNPLHSNAKPHYPLHPTPFTLKLLPLIPPRRAVKPAGNTSTTHPISRPTGAKPPPKAESRKPKADPMIICSCAGLTEADILAKLQTANDCRESLGQPPLTAATPMREICIVANQTYAGQKRAHGQPPCRRCLKSRCETIRNHLHHPGGACILNPRPRVENTEPERKSADVL